MQCGAPLFPQVCHATWQISLAEERSVSMMAAMETRYVIRPDGRGYTVRDLWSGEPARLAGSPQVGLSQDDAEHTANLLNRISAEDGAEHLTNA